MSYVIPTTARYTLDDSVDTLTFSIPAKKQCLYMPMIAIWLVFWGVAAIFVGSILLVGIVQVLTGKTDPSNVIFPGLFFAFWFTFWVVGGMGVLLSVIWQLSGIETIRVTANDLLVERRILGMGRSKLYNIQYIRGMRVVPSESFFLRGRRNYYAQWLFNTGTLAFDYGAKTYRIGNDLEEAEAREVITSIQSRFPQYAS